MTRKRKKRRSEIPGTRDFSERDRLKRERDDRWRAKGYVTTAEAARIVSRPKITIFRWRHAGKLRYEQDGREVYVRIEDLAACSGLTADALGSSP
jgi:hypothetical protein